MSQPIILGTRGSPLALAQTRQIQQKLQSAHPDLTFEIRTITTHGDKLQSLPDHEQPTHLEKGWFTGALENALLKKEVHIVVHSLKDLPTESTSPQLTLAAIPQRAAANDLLLSKSPLSSHNPLKDLPPGSIVGTGSPRRHAQILASQPELHTRSIRGNIGTRIEKLLRDPSLHAIILAQAGIDRLAPDIHSSLHLAPIPILSILPAPGQGALAIQTHTDHQAIIRLLFDTLHHAPTHKAITAERSFLQAMGGGCLAPIAAYAEYTDQRFILHGFYAPEHLTTPFIFSLTSTPQEDPIELGTRLAQLMKLKAK